LNVYSPEETEKLDNGTYIATTMDQHKLQKIYLISRKSNPYSATHILPTPPPPNIRKNANKHPKRPFVLSDANLQTEYDEAVDAYKKQKMTDKEKEVELKDKQKAEKIEKKKQERLTKIRLEEEQKGKRQEVIRNERQQAKHFVEEKKELNAKIRVEKDLVKKEILKEQLQKVKAAEEEFKIGRKNAIYQRKISAVLKKEKASENAENLDELSIEETEENVEIEGDFSGEE
jgi:hypothetical protein